MERTFFAQKMRVEARYLRAFCARAHVGEEARPGNAEGEDSVANHEGHRVDPSTAQEEPDASKEDDDLQHREQPPRRSAAFSGRFVIGVRIGLLIFCRGNERANVRPHRQQVRDRDHDAQKDRRSASKPEDRERADGEDRAEDRGDFGRARDGIARIRRLALRWLIENRDGSSDYWPVLRFDVVSVLRLRHRPPIVDHLRDAF